MSILETFYILFKSDASDVKKGAEEAEKSTKKLSESLKAVDQGALKTGASFLELAQAAAGFLGLGLAVHKVLAGISSANEYALSLGDASKALQVNASALDAWGHAVERTGGTSEGFQHSLKALSEHFGTSASIALATLPKLADTFQRLGTFRALQYGKLLGLDEATILLLQQGRREVEAVIQRQKELGTVNEKDIDIARKYRIANLELDTTFQRLYLTLSQTLTPIFTKLYKAIVPVVEYLIRHKDLVIGALIGIGVAAGIMLAPFLIAQAEIIAVGAALVGLVAIIAIAYEDIKAFFNGQNSFIGDVLNSWELFGKVVSRIIGNLLPQFKAFTTSFEILEGIISRVRNLLSGNNKIGFDLQTGKYLLGLAGENQLTPQSSQALSNTRHFERNSVINTGPITIQTQATDGLGVAKDLGKGIREQLWPTNNYFADGVAY